MPAEVATPHTSRLESARASSAEKEVCDEPPNIYQHFERAFPKVHAARQELAKACYEGGPRDPRSARLVKLGVAIGAQAEGAYVRTLVGRWPRI